MKDTENLAKLVGRADPKWFREVVKSELDTDLPKAPAKAGKKEIRQKFCEALMKLPVAQLRELDSWAERINLLTDVVGKEAVKAIRRENLDADQRAALDAIGNEYDRSLWLYAKANSSYWKALDIRQLKWLWQRKRCHSGFVSQKGLIPMDQDHCQNSLLPKAASFLDCSIDQVAVELFERSDPEGTTKLHVVSIYHNGASEVVEYVEDSEVRENSITRAESIYVTYEPDTGSIHVLSKYRHDRAQMAKLVATELFQTKISGDTIPIKQLDYQCLARPFVFNVSGEPVDWVKVTSLGFSIGGRTMEYRIGVRNPGDIYALARHDLGQEFRFDRRQISAARITVHVQQQPGEKAHSVHIELRGEDGCSVKSERESDRALCDRLLERWGIVKDAADDFPVAANDG